MSKKDRMTGDYFKAMEKNGHISIMVIAIILDTGAIEIIQNSAEIYAKMSYYSRKYDENLCLIANPEIQILNWMFA